MSPASPPAPQARRRAAGRPTARARARRVRPDGLPAAAIERETSTTKKTCDAVRARWRSRAASRRAAPRRARAARTRRPRGPRRSTACAAARRRQPERARDRAPRGASRRRARRAGSSATSREQTAARGVRKVSEATTSVPPARVPAPAPRRPWPSAPEPLPGPCRVAVARVRRSSSSRLYLAAALRGIAADRRLERRARAVVGGDPAGHAAAPATSTPSRFPACDASRAAACVTRSVSRTSATDRARRAGHAVVEAAPGRVRRDGTSARARRSASSSSSASSRPHRVAGQPRLTPSLRHRASAQRVAARCEHHLRTRAASPSTAIATSSSSDSDSPHARAHRTAR